MIDIHVVLATVEDMDHWDEQAEDATEKFNDMLHYLYDKADDDIEVTQFERIIQHVWEFWSKDQHLVEIDVEDLQDWVDHLLATWDDEDSTGQNDDY
ncbi:hypothetical protein [Neptunicella marina]